MPSRVAKPGMMVCAGRVLGAKLFGWPGSKAKHNPRFCMSTPERFGENAAAEGLVDRVDEAAGAAVPVDDRERDGIAARRERDLTRRGQSGKRAPVVDVPRKPGEIIGGEQAV